MSEGEEWGGGEAFTSKANMRNVGITRVYYNTFIKSITVNIDICFKMNFYKEKCKNLIAKKN